MTTPTTLRIEVGVLDSYVLHALRDGAPDAVTLVQAKRFDAPPDLVQAIILLSPLAVSKLLPSIIDLISKQIESKRYVSVECNNVKIAGLTAANAERVLKTVLQHQGGTPTR